MKVLFICRANVGRSQMAEVIFNSLVSGKHTAVSAGTDVGEKEGQKIGERASAALVIAVLKEIGIDAHDNTRTQLTEDMLKNADVVVYMAEPENTPDYLKNDPRTIYWELVDPFEQSLEFTRDTCEKIASLVKDLIVELG